MPRHTLTMALLAATLAALAGSAQAHHSFAAEYDGQQPVAFKGVVTKVEWTNPHTYVYIDVTEEPGKVVNWAFEGYPPNTLKRTGFPRDLRTRN